MSWQSDGVKLLLDISTSGTFISPPASTLYPFTGGGTDTPPNDWSVYMPTGTTRSDIYFTVASGADPPYTRIQRGTLSTIYFTDMGMMRFFNVTPHHTYRISAIGKATHAATAGTTMPTLVAQFNRPNGQNGNRVQSRPFTEGMPDATNWYTFSIDTVATASDGEGLTQLRAEMVARCPTSAASGSVWSMQWADFTITDVTVATAPTFTWHPIVCDTTEASVRYGRSRFTERYDVGTFNIVLNNVSGEYIYQNPHPWGLRPGRIFRMRADYGGTIYPICFGVIDRLKTFMSPDGKATVSMTVYDTTSYTSDIPTPTIAFSSESSLNDIDSLSGNRVNALLNYAGLAQSLRVIDPGVFGTQNVVESGRGLREEIGVTADTEGGSFFGERDGTIVYRDRTWTTRDPNGNTVQAQFTAFPGDLVIDLQPDDIPTDPNAPVICPFNMDTDWSLERVINTITLAPTGGTKRNYRDDPSQKANGVRTYQRLDFVNRGGTSDAFLGGTTTTQLGLRAGDIFSTSLEALLRVQQLSYRPSAETWEFTFNVFLNYLIRVFYYIRDGTWGFATVVRIQSIEHRITPKDWVVTLDVDQPISYTDELTPLPPGGWDIAKWDGSVWDDSEYTSSAIWSRGFRWSNPESKWGE